MRRDVANKRTQTNIWHSLVLCCIHDPLYGCCYDAGHLPSFRWPIWNRRIRSQNITDRYFHHSQFLFRCVCVCVNACSIQSPIDCTADSIKANNRSWHWQWKKVMVIYQEPYGIGAKGRRPQSYHSVRQQMRFSLSLSFPFSHYMMPYFGTSSLPNFVPKRRKFIYHFHYISGRYLLAYSWFTFACI